MASEPDSTSSTQSSSTNSFRHLFESVFSYDGNIMLAAIISLLVVILFVLLLHLYAKWFLAQARQRRRSSMSSSRVLGPTRNNFPHFHTFTFDTTLPNSGPTKGLDPSIIRSIPVFVYKSEEINDNQHKLGMDFECVICLSVFEDNDVGRKLPKCGHVYHVECIDMWLHSHTRCPICRAPVMVSEKKEIEADNSIGEFSETVSGEVGLVDGEPTLEIVIEIPGTDNDVVVNGSLSEASSSSSITRTQSLPLGSSLKRMLSRNRSECKVYPSYNVRVLES